MRMRRNQSKICGVWKGWGQWIKPRKVLETMLTLHGRIQDRVYIVSSQRKTLYRL